MSAIRDPNPVCFMEHKGLYRHVQGEVPEGEHATPIGSARVAREGSELTVIAYGSSVHLALQAAEELDEDIEVLDLRSLARSTRTRFSPAFAKRARRWWPTRRPSPAGSAPRSRR